ncbi:MAG: hypothetical protein J4472_02330, partial [DPANN group archaeon]|nr:hypothetical protein [DPANN group archaeon]
AEVAIKASLDWSIDKIKELALKFKNNDISFLEDTEAFEEALNQLKTEEWKFYKRYIKDKYLRILIELGLTLRKFENDDRKLKYLRDKIHERFDTKGLRIAQVIQNETLLKFSGTLLKINNVAGITHTIEDLLNNVDRDVVFIKETDEVENLYDELKTKIYANLPRILLLISKGSANIIASSVVIKLQSVLDIKNYKSETAIENNKYMFLFSRDLQ